MSVNSGWRSGTQRTIFRTAVKAGWTWRLNGEGHIAMTSPDGAHHLTLSRSANDKGRQAANLKSMARRAGLDV